MAGLVEPIPSEELGVDEQSFYRDVLEQSVAEYDERATGPGNPEESLERAERARKQYLESERALKQPDVDPERVLYDVDGDDVTLVVKGGSGRVREVTVQDIVGDGSMEGRGGAWDVVLDIMNDAGSYEDVEPFGSFYTDVVDEMVSDEEITASLLDRGMWSSYDELEGEEIAYLVDRGLEKMQELSGKEDAQLNDDRDQRVVQAGGGLGDPVYRWEHCYEVGKLDFLLNEGFDVDSPNEEGALNRYNPHPLQDEKHVDPITGSRKWAFDADYVNDIDNRDNRGVWRYTFVDSGDSWEYRGIEDYHD